MIGDTWGGNDFMGAVAAMFVLSGEDLETRVCQVYLDNCKANAAEIKGGRI